MLEDCIHIHCIRMPLQHDLVGVTLSLANHKCEVAYLCSRFRSGFLQGSRELEGGLATLVIVAFYDAHSSHPVRIHSKVVGYRER